MHNSSEFKAKMALAAIRGDETALQLVSRHGLHFAQINSWKRQLIESLLSYFSETSFSKSNNTSKKDGQSTDDLHRVIGQLTMEQDFLARKLNH